MQQVCSLAFAIGSYVCYTLYIALFVSPFGAGDTSHMKTKLKVTTDVGTFTRTTVRTYTHIVVAQSKAEHLEAERLHTISWATKYIEHLDAKLADYAAYALTEKYPDSQPVLENNLDRVTKRKLAAEAQGVITEDGPWSVLGWCGRLDLARKLTTTDQTTRYFRNIRIYAIDGAQVLGLRGTNTSAQLVEAK
jgi:hypothetical protein